MAFLWNFGDPGQGASSLSQEGLRPGQLFAQRLEILEILGEGAMGRVFRARDPELGRDVAIKVMLSPLDEAQRARFGREIELTASLRHPNVVTIHHAGVTREGLPFLVLELIEGARSLDEAFSDLTQGERLETLQEVADAVAFLHHHEVVHRDLKPENILVDRAGRPRLCDLGLARHFQDQDDLTQTGALVGTPLFMAPEQFTSKADRSVDPRIDVWALGVLLHQALTDRHPFSTEDGNLLEFMARLQAGLQGTQRELSRAASPALAKLCARALEPSPGRRLPHAGAFSEALREAIASPRGAYRRPLGLVAVAAVVALALAAVWIGGREEAPKEPPGEAVVVETPIPKVERPAPTLVTPAPPTEPRTAREFYNRGALRHIEGDLSGALVDLNRALELEPELVLAVVHRAAVYALLGDDQSSEADFSRAIAIDPKHAAAHSGRGVLRMRAGNLDGAIFDLTQAVDLDPNNAGALNNRGSVRRSLGDLRGALGDYTRSIALDPNSTLPYNGRGLVRRDMGDLRGAIEDHSWAVVLAPDESLGYTNRGGAKLALGDQEGAWADFQKAIEVDPTDAMAYANRGVIKGKRGDLLPAIADFDISIELNPKSPLGFRNRGFAREQLGDLREALADYEQALKLSQGGEAQGLREAINRIQLELWR